MHKTIYPYKWTDRYTRCNSYNILLNSLCCSVHSETLPNHIIATITSWCHGSLLLPFWNQLSWAREGKELVEGARRRLYSKEVGGRGPGPRRRAGAMVEAQGLMARRKGRSSIQSKIQSTWPKTLSGHGLYNAKPEENLFTKLTQTNLIIHALASWLLLSRRL